MKFRLQKKIIGYVRITSPFSSSEAPAAVAVYSPCGTASAIEIVALEAVRWVTWVSAFETTITCLWHAGRVSTRRRRVGRR
jgi:hypothetical protein